MKYLVLIGDGMGDYPRDDLGGKTVLEAARTPNMDRIARIGKGGLMTDHPRIHGTRERRGQHGDPRVRHHEDVHRPVRSSRRSAWGVKLRKKDVAFRANLVTLADGRDEGLLARATSPPRRLRELLKLTRREPRH